MKAAAYLLAKHPDDKVSSKELQEVRRETLLRNRAELKVPRWTEARRILKKLREDREPPKKQPRSG